MGMRHPTNEHYCNAHWQIRQLITIAKSVNNYADKIYKVFLLLSRHISDPALLIPRPRSRASIRGEPNEISSEPSTNTTLDVVGDSNPVLSQFC